MGSSRSSASRSSSPERSLPEARQVIGERLRARKDEIEQELLARVGAFSQDESVDPEYAVGLRDSVPIALEYGIECIESSERSAPSLPTSLYAQARLAARNDVKLDTVLERYIGGYTLLDSFLEEAASVEGLVGTSVYKEIRRVSSVLIQKLIADIGNQYHDEVQMQAASPESARVRQTRELLSGKLVDLTQFNYDFSDFHIGLVARGPGSVNAIKELVRILDCVPMTVYPPEAPVWTWLSRRTPPDPSQVKTIVCEIWPNGSRLALGEISQGLAGWRTTHRQALAAWLTTNDLRPVARYQEVALLASALQDDLLVHSLRTRILKPLEDTRYDRHQLCDMIRIYLETGQNVSSTAIRLKINRRTVSARLETIERVLQAPLSEFVAELDLALQLDQFESQSLLPP